MTTVLFAVAFAAIFAVSLPPAFADEIGDDESENLGLMPMQPKLQEGFEIHVGVEVDDALAGVESNMVLTDALEDAFPGSKTPVYQDGESVGKWRSCTEAGAGEDECFVMGIYLDRIFFNMEWHRQTGDQYLLDQPVVSVDGTGMIPTVERFNLSREEGTGSFQVFINCREAPGQRARIIIQFNLSESETIRFAWFKTCGFGAHPYVELGFFKSGEQFGTALSKVTPETADELPVDDKPMGGTPFYILARAPALYQEYGAPLVKSASDKIVGTVQGHSTGGFISVSTPVTLFVVYECLANVTAELNMTIPIPPFLPLVGKWKKVCVVPGSTDATKGIKINLENGLLTPVYTNGRLHDEFVPGKDSTWVIGETDRMVLFRVQNTDSTALTVGSVTAHATDPRIVHVSLAQNASEPGFLTGYGSVTLSSQERVSIGIRLVCKSAGETDVFVRVFVLNGEPVDFGLHKKCTAPKVLRRRVYFTATSYLAAIVVAVVATLVGGVLLAWQGSSKLSKVADAFATPVVEKVKAPLGPTITRV